MFLKTCHVLTQRLLRTPTCPVFLHSLWFWDLWFCVICTVFLKYGSFRCQSDNTSASPLHGGIFSCPLKRHCWYRVSLVCPTSQKIARAANSIIFCICASNYFCLNGNVLLLSMLNHHLLVFFIGLLFFGGVVVCFLFFGPKRPYSPCFPEQPAMFPWSASGEVTKSEPHGCVVMSIPGIIPILETSYAPLCDSGPWHWLRRLERG